ncbi:hypothetical protein R6Q59_023568 [Mikania micrantha]
MKDLYVYNVLMSSNYTISRIAASASATRIFDIPFYFSSNEWHLLLEILAILSMILGNLIAITQTSMKRMLAYSSIGQIGYVIIGIIVGDSNDGYASMITYMLFYISMNLGIFACIVLFGLRTGTENIRDYAGLYTKDPFLALSLALCLLSLGGLPPLAEVKISFLSFNEHLVFHKNWEQYNPYVKAILSNFQALRYVSNVDDYHKRFPTYHKIPVLENPHFSKPRKQTEF